MEEEEEEEDMVKVAVGLQLMPQNGNVPGSVLENFTACLTLSPSSHVSEFPVLENSFLLIDAPF